MIPYYNCILQSHWVDLSIHSFTNYQENLLYECRDQLNVRKTWINSPYTGLEGYPSISQRQ